MEFLLTQTHRNVRPHYESHMSRVTKPSALPAPCTADATRTTEHCPFWPAFGPTVLTVPQIGL
jgi:hypothetical protein